MSTSISYESILESISGGFFAMDAEFRITYWNKAVEAGTGMPASDVLGRSVFDVFPNARDAEIGEKYRLAMEMRTYQSVESAYRDERFEKWFDARIYPADGGLSVFFQDVTEHKQEMMQKEALVEISKAVNTAGSVDDLSQRCATVLAAMEDIPEKLVCVYLFDARANELRLVAPASLEIDFPVELVHQRVHAGATTLAARSAYTKEHVVTGNLADGTLGRLLDGTLDHLMLRSVFAIPLLVQQEVHGVIEIMTIKDPSYIEERLAIFKVIANDMAVGLSRRRLIDDLRMKNIELEAQTEKTEEASDTLKKFLAMFSHELRSPLNSIIGFSELLTSDLQDLPPETMREFMKNIQVSGRHLQQILNDILDLSKIEAGQLELHIATYPTPYFEEAVQRVLSSAIAAKRIRLAWQPDPDLDELVVDQTRFKQILINLVSNAVKFSRDGGVVEVSSRRVGNDMVFSVKDYGRGIRPEEIPGLFRPFRRAESGKAHNREGVGLGLAITRRLVELHGGTIWIESEWEKGTTVSFRIPLIVDATSERIMQAGMLLDALKRENWRKEGGEKPLALIVEDSPQAGELLKVYIESAGYRAEIARNGADAVDMAKRLHPNVITLDLILPGKDGWTVMKELKKHPLCKHIPVIIVSIIDEKSLGFSLGAAEYFVKPVNREELVQAMDRVHVLPGRDAKRPTVLVVDDDKSAADLVQVILENEGYRVLKANDGADGVAMAIHERPDVVMLDLLMPGMSGFAVAQQLRQVPATRNIPIIVLTSMDVDEEMQEQLGSSVSGLMSKAQFTKRDLLREITNVENARWP
jgi:PAS domain S-box-containing protein